MLIQSERVTRAAQWLLAIVIPAHRSCIQKFQIPIPQGCHVVFFLFDQQNYAHNFAVFINTRVSQARRTMATEKQILMQINATKNIRKITASMKMVSAAKLKGDETRLHLAEPFCAWTKSLVPEAKPIENATYEELPNKVLLVPFTTERGLCGGVNSFISKGVKTCIYALQEQGKTCDIAVIGEKGRTQLRRAIGSHIVRSATDVAAPGTFALASSLASEIMAAFADKEYDAIVLMYNHYLNAALYKQMYQVLSPLPNEGEEGEPLMEYEFDGDKKELMVDMGEYLIASQIFYSFMDSAASEQSSRMQAMENASKNAGEMIDSLTIQYNRARQARITTELIEIISGASALDN
jgi:F-type H+-transporting ATPase subunit gamma